MTNHSICMKFKYKGYWIYLLVNNLAEIATEFTKNSLRETMVIYECDLINYVYEWLHSRVRGIVCFEAYVAPDRSTVSGFRFRLNGTDVGEFVSASESVLGEFEYTLNKEYYLNLPSAISGFAAELQLFGQSLSILGGRAGGLNPSGLNWHIWLAWGKIKCEACLSQTDANELFKGLDIKGTDDIEKIEKIIREAAWQFPLVKDKGLKVIKANLTKKINQNKQFYPFGINCMGYEFQVFLTGLEQFIQAKDRLTKPDNRVNNFILPFKLVHGAFKITTNEIAELAKGDVVFFDQCYAPGQVLLTTSATVGVLCSVAENQLRVKEIYL